MTEDDFFAAIKEAPADDLPRLAYADWLDEQPQTACRYCSGLGTKGGIGRTGDAADVPCSICEGSGVRPYSQARAEFVRLQVEIAGFDESYYLSYANRWYCLRSAVPRIARSAELLHDAWSDSLAGRFPYTTSFTDWEFRRGFLHRAFGSFEELLGTYCRACDGVGDDGGRGYSDKECVRCGGSGGTPGVLPFALRGHPIADVRVAFAVPDHGHFATPGRAQVVDRGYGWVSRDGHSRPFAAAVVPEDVYEFLEPYYPTEADAYAALSRAVLAAAEKTNREGPCRPKRPRSSARSWPGPTTNSSGWPTPTG